MNLRHTLILISILFMKNSLSECNGVVDVGLWRMEIGGSIIGQGGTGSGAIKRQKDSSTTFGAKLEMFENPVTVQYNKVSYNTTVDIQAKVTFDGQDYDLGENIELGVDWSTVDITFRGGEFFQNIHNHHTGLYSGMRLVYGIQAVQTDIVLESINTGSKSTVDASFPIPFIGVEGHLALEENLQLGFGIKGLKFSAADSDLSYFDSMAGLYYFFEGEREVSAFLGYKDRSLDITIDKGTNQEAGLDLSMKGPVLEASIGF
jgi:hypothetical protein